MLMYIKPFFFFLMHGTKKSTLEIVYFSCFSAALLMPGIWLLGLK